MFDPNPEFGNWTLLAVLRGLTLMFIFIALVELKPWCWPYRSFNYGLAVFSMTAAAAGLIAGLSSSLISRAQQAQPSFFLVDAALMIAATCWTRIYGAGRNEL